MPTYVYKREDGTTFEIQQRITEDALEVCPETGQTVKRVITGGTGLIFKGDGFYLTDYVRNGSNGDGTKSPNGKDEATSSNDETKSASPTETSGSSDASTSSESTTA